MGILYHLPDIVL